MDCDIGSRLRHARKLHKLSQRKLAKRAGVTHSTISLVESGRTNPSIGSLKRILKGIPITLSQFFATDFVPTQASFFRADELVEIGSGPISYLRVGTTLPERALQILKERYESGADTGIIPLTHEGEEGGIILAGRLEVTVDGERRVLGPGDAYLFESRRPHRFRCVGTSPCELITACTPASF